MIPVRVILPFVPPIACSPNHNGPWRTKSAAIKQLRSQTKLLLIHRINMGELPLKSIPATPVLIVANINWPSGRRNMDHSNAAASLKGMVDGMTDAGFWPDDKDIHVVVSSQRMWGKLDPATRTFYPDGCIVLDLLPYDPAYFNAEPDDEETGTIIIPYQQAVRLRRVAKRAQQWVDGKSSPRSVSLDTERKLIEAVHDLREEDLRLRDQTEREPIETKTEADC